jgi:hypothetical protein
MSTNEGAGFSGFAFFFACGYAVSKPAMSAITMMLENLQVARIDFILSIPE